MGRHSWAGPVFSQMEIEALGAVGAAIFVLVVMLAEMVPLLPTQPLSLAAGLLFGPVKVLLPPITIIVLQHDSPANTARKARQWCRLHAHARMHAIRLAVATTTRLLLPPTSQEAAAAAAAAAACDGRRLHAKGGRPFCNPALSLVTCSMQ